VKGVGVPLLYLLVSTAKEAAKRAKEAAKGTKEAIITKWLSSLKSWGIGYTL